MLLVLLLLIINSSWARVSDTHIRYRSIRNGSNEVGDLIQSGTDDLVLLFMGDTQYYFKCEPKNVPCKMQSQAYRKAAGLSFDCGLRENIREVRTDPINDFIREKIVEPCVEKESLFANHIQKDAIKNLINEMRNKPAALIINGDLTNYGHLHQLQQFEKEWLSLPIRILPGLGNHDYENNVDDCFLNHCASRMLSWFVTYCEKHGLKPDYRRKSKEIFKTVYIGSFAYVTTVSSESGSTRAYVIQLNNRPNYATHINTPYIEWIVTSSLSWLAKELDKITEPGVPVFINLHNLDTQSKDKLKQLLKNWIIKRGSLSNLQVYIMHAHEHSEHRIDTECVSIKLPSIFVGSVPLNRLTAVRISPNRTAAQIYLLKVEKEHFMTVDEYVEFTFTPC